MCIFSHGLMRPIGLKQLSQSSFDWGNAKRNHFWLWPWERPTRINLRQPWLSSKDDSLGPECKIKANKKTFREDSGVRCMTLSAKQLILGGFKDKKLDYLKVYQNYMKKISQVILISDKSILTVFALSSRCNHHHIFTGGLQGCV